jgi:hypothetical protein
VSVPDDRPALREVAHPGPGMVHASQRGIPPQAASQRNPAGRPELGMRATPSSADHYGRSTIFPRVCRRASSSKASRTCASG